MRIFIKFVVVIVSIVFLCGCHTPEWDTIHEGKLLKAEISVGPTIYWNVQFDDGQMYSFPSSESSVIGWKIGDRYRLQHRMIQRIDIYQMVRLSGVESEADHLPK